MGKAWIKGEVGTGKVAVILLLTVPRRFFILLWILFVICINLCHTAIAGTCSFEVTVGKYLTSCLSCM